MHIAIQVLISLGVLGALIGGLILLMLWRERQMNDKDEHVKKYKEHQAMVDALSKIAPDIFSGFRGKPSEIDEAAGRATRTLERSDGRWSLAYRRREKQETLALTHLGTKAVLVAIFHGGQFKGFGDKKHLPDTARPNEAIASLAQEAAEEFRRDLARDLDAA